MKRWMLTASLAAPVAAALLLAPASASASCSDRKVTGTVLGGVGGALVGNSIAGGGGGAILGGLGGAVLGHEVARSTCGSSYHRRAEYDSQYRDSGYNGAAYHHGRHSRRGYYQDAAAPATGGAYYDQNGRLVNASLSSTGPEAPAPACRPETVAYYDDRGTLQQRVGSTCAR